MKAEDNQFPRITFREQASSPFTPSAGLGLLFEKSDGFLYFLNDAGVETKLGAGGSGGSGGSTATAIYRVADNQSATLGVPQGVNSDLNTVVVTTTSANDIVMISAESQVRVNNNSAGTLALLRDFLPLESQGWHSEANIIRSHPSITYLDRPGLGSFTYLMRGSNDAGSGDTAVYQYRRLTATVLSITGGGGGTAITTPYAASIYRAAAWSIDNTGVNTQVQMPYDTLVAQDGGLWNAANPAQLTIPSGGAGWYTAIAQVGGQSGMNAWFRLVITVNGTTRAEHGETSYGGDWTHHSITKSLKLAVGDVVTVAYEWRGGSIPGWTGEADTYLTLVKNA